MPYLAYDPATGEIVGAVKDSPEWAANKAAKGFSVLRTERMADPVGDYVLNGEMKPKVLVTFTPDKALITADGAEQAVVSVSVAGESPPESIAVLVGDIEQEVALSGGQGQTKPIAATTPCTIEIDVADPITYRAEPVEVEAISGE
ncbi:MAG: hypothetical protein K9K66_04480 [Desulfarculaceae bacterium]|nr:hypothetical protein [Desulfarculaceae bacterium]MCF8073300.1 hypothetical protein [Desulfarculaceae bacterium]MCF8100896.1 hypothetical protein [Desulfarculaceae bacterium]MCF8116648.1 hypothetical protein [Desulfarculaceae bacterium]